MSLMLRSCVAICIASALALATIPVQAVDTKPASRIEPTGAGIPYTVSDSSPTQRSAAGDSMPKNEATSETVVEPIVRVRGKWLSSGVVSLDWEDIPGVDGYEVMTLLDGSWILLDPRSETNGIVMKLDGSSAIVAGLPHGQAKYEFVLRTRNSTGLSSWTNSTAIGVPAATVVDASRQEPFDPFSDLTHPRLDIERVRRDVATLDVASDCSAVAGLNVAGVDVVAPPANIDDPTATLTVAEVARIVDGCLIVEYISRQGRSLQEVRDILSSDPTVLAVGEPVRGLELEHVDLNTATPDPAMPTAHYTGDGQAQWHLTEEFFGPDGLWDTWDPKVSITVAVFDSGVDVAHPDLRNQQLTGNLPTCHRQDGDEDGHGTHVAGIIAAEQGNGATISGTAGVAPSAKILSVRVLYRSEGRCQEERTAAQAVADAVNSGARVINMSLRWHRSEREKATIGGVVIDTPLEDSFMLALRAASMLGIVSITSVGNCGSDTDITIDGETKKSWEWNNCGQHNQLAGPASYPEVISISAVQHHNNGDGLNRATFSTFNQLVDIAAPGHAIVSTERCIRRTGTPPSVTCGTVSKGGTSQAAPFVSGVVAHMLNRYPRATYEQVRQALEETAVPPQGQPVTARNRVDDDGNPVDVPGATDPSAEFGHGVVQPAAAVRRLGELVDPPSVPAEGGFEEVVAGDRHTCGRRASGAVRCWGDADVSKNTPGLAFASLSAPSRSSLHGCGIRRVRLDDESRWQGTAMCWGAVSASVPRVVQGTFGEVRSGPTQTCGLRPAGHVVCWDNATGTDVAGPSGEFTTISGSWHHWCGLRVGGTAVCWGNAADGKTAPPVGVAFSRVDAGGSHTCGVTKDKGAIRCWGSFWPRATAPRGTGFVSVDAGQSHACAIRSSVPAALFRVRGGEVVCWGDLTAARLNAPADERLLSVSVGWRHACGVRPDGTVVCWGDNTYGQAPQARLATLSLTLPDGTELMTEAGGFDKDDTEYTILPRSATGTVSWTVEDNATAAPVFLATDTSGSPVSTGSSVSVRAGDSVAITVSSLFGFGPSRTYLVHFAPRLSGLSVRAETGKSDCPGAGCPPYELIPAFDPEIFEYRAVVPAELDLVTVGYSATGSQTVQVSPSDARPPLSGNRDPVSGHQIQLRTAEGFASVSAGSRHFCGVKLDGSVACWGSDSYGQSSPPAGLFTSVSAGTYHSCGIKRDNSVACWGANRSGQSSPPIGAFESVAVGNNHSCGVRSDKSVECWGYNGAGQSSPPEDSFLALSVGSGHTCGIKTDMTLSCWGHNGKGQATPPQGNYSGISTNRSQSCAIRQDSKVICWGEYADSEQLPSDAFSSISVGQGHSCGIEINGGVNCWSRARDSRSSVPSGSFLAVAANYYGACGVRPDNAMVCWGWVPHPVLSPPTGQYQALSTGIGYACAVKIDGTLVCWGGEHAYGPSPLGLFRSVSVGHGHACALRTDWTAVCWSTEYVDSHRAPPGSFRSVSAGVDRTCGLRMDQSIECWGYTHPLLDPPSTGTYISVSVGDYNTCAVRTTGSLYCWGNAPALTPSAREAQFTSVSMGYDFACGVKTDGGVECWGRRSGSSREPAIQTFASVSVSSAHACGLTKQGAVLCWGSDSGGSASPPKGTFAAVSVSGVPCGIRSDKSLACWGGRSAEMEPAAREAVTLEVRGAGSAVVQDYRLTLDRPQPSRPTMAAAQTGGNLSSAHAAVGNPCAPTVVAIDDTRLRAAVEAALGKGAGDWIRPAELAELTELRLPRHGSGAAGEVLSLAGLEGATGLKTLDLAGHDVSDLRALRCLAALETLVLSGNDLSAAGALSPLKELTSLRTLWLDRTGVVDLSALSRLTGLRRLYLYGNGIADVSPLAGLTQLTDLHLDHNEIRHIMSLSALTRLRAFGVGGNWLEGMDAVASMSGLEELYVYDNDIGGLSPVAAMSGLTTLWASGNDFSDLTPLGGLTGLGYADMRGNRISDPTPLYGLASRTSHLLPQQDDIVVFDESALARAVHDAVGDPAVEAISKRQMARLTAFAYRGDQLGRRAISSLAGFEHATALASLDVAGNLVSDLGPLSGLAKLADLNLASNKVTSLDALAGLAALTRLNLSGNRVASLGPLAGLSGLETLDLTDADLDDVSALAALTSLKTLRVAENCISDFSALDTITGLTITGAADQRQPAAPTGTPGIGSSGSVGRTCRTSAQIGFGSGSGLGSGSGPGSGLGF